VIWFHLIAERAGTAAGKNKIAFTATPWAESGVDPSALWELSWRARFDICLTI
jgi:hypothetical protein